MRNRTKHNRKLGFLPILLSLCAGCAPTEEASAPDRSVLPPSVQTLSFEEHMDISIGYWDIDNMVKATQPDGMTQYIEELFNITLHPVSVTWSNYKERYQILSATDSLPDIFATITLSSTDNKDSATFLDMISTGSIRALPEDMSLFPALNGLLESVSYTQHSDGSYYAIPRVSFTDSILAATDAAMIVRRDWMNALELGDPQSFEDFAAMAAAFAHEDPDGNGLDDTIGYNASIVSALGKWVVLGIAPACNVYSWVEADGRFVPTWTTDAFREVVQAFRLLYESGGLDPEFYSKSPSIALEDFAAGRLGALEYKSSPAALMELKARWDVLNDLPFEECVDVLPVFPAPDGVRYSNSSSIFWSESYFSSSVDDAKMERILALFEYLLSEPGQDFCHYGIKGIDYEEAPDGSLRCLLDTGTESLATVLAQKYPSSTLFSGIATWGGGSWADFEENDLNALRFGAYNMKLAHDAAVWCDENTTQLERAYAFLNYPKEATDQFSNLQVLESFVDCVTGRGDPLLLWDAVLEKMRKNGLEEYIDRQNQAYQDSGM